MREQIIKWFNSTSHSMGKKQFDKLMEIIESSAPPAGSIADSRKEFEQWLEKPPYERDCLRHGSATAWPGQYLDYDVQLAWEAWQQARQ